MSGYLFFVYTKRLGEDGKPMCDVYAAWIEDDEEAREAVTKQYLKTPDEIPRIAAELDDPLLRGMGLKPGEVARVQTLA